jgi:hypothetical protein
MDDPWQTRNFEWYDPFDPNPQGKDDMRRLFVSIQNLTPDGRSEFEEISSLQFQASDRRSGNKFYIQSVLGRSDIAFEDNIYDTQDLIFYAYLKLGEGEGFLYDNGDGQPDLFLALLNQSKGEEQSNPDPGNDVLNEFPDNPDEKTDKGKLEEPVPVLPPGNPIPPIYGGFNNPLQPGGSGDNPAKPAGENPPKPGNDVPSPVPEPSTLILTGSGLLFLLHRIRKFFQ